MNTETLQRYIAGGLSREERNVVADWICEDAEHLKEYKALRHLYDISLWNASGQSRKARPRKSAHRVWLAAASIALLVACGIGFKAHSQHNTCPPLAPTSVTVPPGKDLKLDLADGSQVQLNAGSRLQFCSDKNGRRVRLDGEGYFIIATDPKSPFIVETFGHSVKVTGTEFNVKAREDDRLWEVALVKGSVSILNTEGKVVTNLTPGKKIALTGNSLIVSKLDGKELLWKDNILSFDNLTLDEILNRISEFYGIRFDSSALRCGQKRYTGKFRTQWGYEHILKSLQMINEDFSYSTPEDDECDVVRIY